MHSNPKLSSGYVELCDPKLTSVYYPMLFSLVVVNADWSSSPCVIRLVYVVFPFRNHWHVCVLCRFGGLLGLLGLGGFLS
jgi:hypothetical protein